ncbi:ParB/RepB/Spo0J family partition protein [Erysipelothrix anatis]|uniref:ParB/RepB/Spo0J family partition protein n=1 Tax=Erysipelothrix anatis TaxID=2683713 RepID=UPI00140B515A|nr:ParB N-terminal domain-containing protein [Erysipelothrix anatis]
MTSEEKKKQDDLRKAGFSMLKRNTERVKTTRDLLLDNGDSEYREISIYDLVPNPNNKYPVEKIDELAESIKEYGLQQNLVVKPTGDGTYMINAGNRRHKAMLKILENDTDKDYIYLQTQTCLVLSEHEDEIITQLRKHVTNTDARSLLQLPEDEKLEIIEDYMFWLTQAREQNLEINGKPIKGKTRDLVAERFGVSLGTAQNLIKSVRKNEEGTNLSPPKTTVEEKLEKKVNKINNQLKKVYEQVETVCNDIDVDDIERIKVWLNDIKALL